MDGNADACADCTRSCLLLHRARLDPSPAAHSFFKVMFGTEFSKELIVPPRFVRTLNSLEGRDTYLEDSTGQKWDIRLAKVKGSLVIQRGWQEFALDHGIELGDVLVFHYITRSHFIVQIFTRSGCEKPVLFSGINYQNKRIKAARDSDARKGSDGSDAEILPKENSCSRVASGLDVDSAKSLDNVRRSVRLAEDRPVEGNPRKRPKVPPAKDPLVEPYFMTSRSTNFSREDDRDYLFDLSAFEMPTTKVCTEEKSIVEVNRYQGVSQSQNAQMGTSSVDIIKWQIGEMNPLLAPS